MYKRQVLVFSRFRVPVWPAEENLCRNEIFSGFIIAWPGDVYKRQVLPDGIARGDAADERRRAVKEGRADAQQDQRRAAGAQMAQRCV